MVRGEARRAGRAGSYAALRRCGGRRLYSDTSDLRCAGCSNRLRDVVSRSCGSISPDTGNNETTAARVGKPSGGQNP
jgi:hypothetical protein